MNDIDKQEYKRASLAAKQWLYDRQCSDLMNSISQLKNLMISANDKEAVEYLDSVWHQIAKLKDGELVFRSKGKRKSVSHD